MLPECLPPERRRKFEWRRANPFGTFRQMQKHPVVLGILGALFIWMVANALFTDPRNTGVTLLIILAGAPVYWLRARLARGR